MPRPQRSQLPGALYHVMARGDGGKQLFFSEGDYRSFLGLLEECRTLFAFEVHAFCLMPNHVHLLLRLGSIALSRVMQRLLGLYGRRFNDAAERQGKVFQDRYKSLMCCSDAYYLAIVRYIHRNPLKAGLTKTLEEWRWSSLHSYLGGDSGVGITRNTIREILGGGAQEAQRRFMEFHLGSSPDPEGLGESLEWDPCDEARAGLGDGMTAPEDPRLEALMASVARGVGVDGAILRSRSRASSVLDARKFFILAGLREGRRCSDIARYLGVSKSAVSHCARRASALGVLLPSDDVG